MYYLLLNVYGSWEAVPEDLRELIGGDSDQAGGLGQGFFQSGWLNQLYRNLFSTKPLAGTQDPLRDSMGSDSGTAIDPYYDVPFDLESFGSAYQDLRVRAGFEGGSGNGGSEEGGDAHDLFLVNFMAAQTDTRWHHLIPQNPKHQQTILIAFQGTGFSIHQASNGWLMLKADHDAITPRWTKEWNIFFRDNPNPTPQQIETKLKRMKKDKFFAEYLRRGSQADEGYYSWNKLSSAAKDQKFAKLRRAARLLGAVLVVVGAADQAEAAFGPVLTLGDKAAQDEYQAALIALRDQQFDVAEKELFGQYGVEREAVLFEENSDGLIPKMLGRMASANELSRHNINLALSQAWAAWGDLVSKAKAARDLGAIKY